ncbi:MAG: hemerythrin domain-containing protein [Candidatus Zixiibacteriota bacterium]
MKKPPASHLHVIQVLLDEHVAINEALLVLFHLKRRLAGRSLVRTSDLRTLIAFFRVYADTIHHGTEEDVLFPAVQRSRTLRSMSQKLLTHHTMGRIFLDEMTKAVEAAASGRRGWRKRFVGSATAYHTLLTIHICDEDHIFFPRAERSLRRMNRVRLRVGADDLTKTKWERQLRRLFKQHVPVDQTPHTCSDSSCQ